MGALRKSSVSRRETFEGQHRFEHWYRDNSLYLVTARVTDKKHVFLDSRAQEIFWTTLDRYSRKYGVALWVATLMSNHYHLQFYLRFGENLGPFMQRLHGAVAKQVNDLLPEKVAPFWSYKGRQTYWDGCLRTEVQARRTYGYILRQSVRVGLVKDWRKYSNTKVFVEMAVGLKRARELKVYLVEVPYERYQGKKKKS